MDYWDTVLVCENMPKSVWSTYVFWFYVELFHLLSYKYLYGFGVNANRWGAIATNVIWRQQSFIPYVWVWFGAKRPYTQRPTIIGKRKLENESFNRRITIQGKNN